MKSSPLDLIYVFFSATRHSNVSLKKTLLSKNSLIPSHTHSPLKKKTLHRTQKTLSFPHSQSSHTHSPLTQKNSVSLSLHSILVSAPVTHSLIRLRRCPSLSLIPSLQLHCRHLLRRRRPSISLRLSLSFGLSLSFPLCRFAVSFSVAVAVPINRRVFSFDLFYVVFGFLYHCMIFAYFLFLICSFIFLFLGCNVNWVEINGFLDFYFYKMFIIININIIYFYDLNWVWLCTSYAYQ